MNNHTTGIVYKCPKKGSATNCINSFLKKYNIILVRIPPDGDCFFHSISKFFETRGIKRTHTELRKIVISYMERHKDDYIPFFLANSNMNNHRKYSEITKQFNELKRSGAWNNELADFIPQEAPKALNINIRLFELSYDKSYISAHILRDDTKNINITNNYYTVNILRVSQNHYELLIPPEDFILNKLNFKNKNNSTNKNKNSKKNTTRKNNTFSKNELNEIAKQFNIIKMKENEALAKKMANIEKAKKEEVSKELNRQAKIQRYLTRKAQERAAASTKKNTNKKYTQNELVNMFDKLMEEGGI